MGNLNNRQSCFILEKKRSLKFQNSKNENCAFHLSNNYQSNSYRNILINCNLRDTQYNKILNLRDAKR